MVLLATSQVCSFATAFLFVFFGPFAVIDMGGGAALGGLPFAIAFLATPVATIPAGLVATGVARNAIANGRPPRAAPPPMSIMAKGPKNTNRNPVQNAQT